MDMQLAAADTKSGEESGRCGKIFKILVIGETGSGKSTFINYLTNYFLDGSLDNLKVAIPTRYLSATENFPHSEKDITDLTGPKTEFCHEYSFVDHHTSNRYVFIDTPGLFSTHEIEQEQVNMRNIVDAVGKMGSLSAIITVINGSVQLIGGDLPKILTHLHKDFKLDNVVNIVMLTNTHQWSSNFNVQCLSSVMSKIHPFYVQMSAFSIDLKKLDERVKKERQFHWEESMAEIQKTLGLIDSLAPHF